MATKKETRTSYSASERKLDIGKFSLAELSQELLQTLAALAAAIFLEKSEEEIKPLKKNVSTEYKKNARRLRNQNKK